MYDTERPRSHIYSEFLYKMDQDKTMKYDLVNSLYDMHFYRMEYVIL